MDETETKLRQRLATTSPEVLARTLKVLEGFDFMGEVGQMVKDEVHMRRRMQQEVRKRL